MALESQQVLFRILLRIDPVMKNQQRIRERTDSIAISSSTFATPIEITTSTVHGLKTGQKVFIFGHTTNTPANNTLSNPAWTITYVSTTKFTLNGSVGTGVGSAGTVVPGYVGSVGGDKFPTAQQQLDIYNSTRWALMGFVLSAHERNPRLIDPEKLLPGWVLRKIDLTFASGSVAKPTGYVKTLKLHTAAGIRIPVLTPTEYERVKNKLSVSNPAVEDRGTVLFDATGGTNVPNAGTYVLNYLALTDFTIGDILQLAGYTNTTEPLDQQRHEVLYRGATAIARGAGADELNLIFGKELGIG